MADKFSSYSSTLSAPAFGAAPVIPSDAQELTTTSRAIYVGSSGNLTVEMLDNGVSSTITLQNVQAGMLYPLRVRRVLASGTTASGLVCFW